MHSIALYLELGLKHISDLVGYDHILFLVALCAVYRVEDWRRLIILVTAFTIGHSITLALSSFEIVVIPSNVVEFLIPVTIFLTALRNVTSSSSPGQSVNMTSHSVSYTHLTLPTICSV